MSVEWQSPERWNANHQSGWTMRFPFYGDCRSVHNWLVQNTELRNISAYDVPHATSNVIGVVAAQAACTDYCKDGESILVGETRVYNYNGTALLVHMWHPEAIARQMWATGAARETEGSE